MNSTLDAYNKYAHVYENETQDFWNKFPRTTIDQFVAHLNGTKILSIGSGSGRGELLLKEKGLEVTCLDGSESMVKITRNLGFDSIVQNFRELSFPPSAFDGVWAYTSLVHIMQEEIVSVLQKIQKILKPRGLLLIGMIEGDYSGEKERASMPGVKRYFRYYFEDELEDLVSQTGFKMITQEKYHYSKTYIHQLYEKID